MRSLVAMGKVNIHIDQSNGMLNLLASVEDGDRILYVFYPDLIDRDLSVVPLVLNVFHLMAVF